VRRAALLAFIVVTAGCGSSHRPVAVAVTPGLSNEDQPIDISVTGLAPKQGVYISLRAVDAHHIAFVSKAAYAADAHGVVDTTRATALRGSSYAGVWPMGLITSMSAPNAKPFTFYWWGENPQRFVVTVVSNRQTIAKASFRRRWSARRATVVHATLAKQGFVGTFYAPRGARGLPSVLMLGGSEGGSGPLWQGERLAADGVAALALGYFHAPGLPDRLVNIPLEYFRRALVWLERRPEVAPSRTSVAGVSYGSEAALLLGVHYPGLVHGVAALVPSNRVTCGILGAERSGPCLGSPWTVGGKPLPYAGPRSVIRVERIAAPLFLDCSGRDEVWISCPYARAIVARRKAHGEMTQLIIHPRAGHSGGNPFFVYEPGSLAVDFFVPADERAREDLTPRLLAFLQRS
jgi:dienelactone hydrolase